MENRIEDWCKQIEIHEGYYPGSASYRNNNSGNFRCSPLIMGELGATKCVNNLAVFPDYKAGWNALKHFLIYACTDKLRSYKSTMTLLDFYKVYAPSADHNNPLNYATAVAKGLGVPITTQIKDLYQEVVAPKPEVVSVNQSIFWQRNPRYKGIKLGNSNLDFQNNACFTCCLAYMVQEDPLVVMNKLRKNGGFNGALINSAQAAKILGLDLLGGNSNIPGKTTDINYMPDWTPTIKEVSLNGHQHFVVRLIENGVRKIFDPWTGRIQSINLYPFRSYRLFRK